MAKRRLQEFMAKMDDEFEVTIISYENILLPDMAEKVRLALMPFKLRELRKGGIKYTQEAPPGS